MNAWPACAAGGALQLYSTFGVEVFSWSGMSGDNVGLASWGRLNQKTVLRCRPLQSLFYPPQRTSGTSNGRVFRPNPKPDRDKESDSATSFSEVSGRDCRIRPKLVIKLGVMK